MKIVHVLTRLLRAGSEENTIASCKGQIANGHEVYLVHGRDFDARYYETLSDIKLLTVKSLVHHLDPVQDVRAFVEMRSLFKQLKPDVVHTHQSKAGVVGRLAAAAARVPIIVHGVHIVPFVNVGKAQRLVYLAAERAAAKFTDAFIDVSRGMKELCLAERVGREDNHHVIHSGFDLDRFTGSDLPEDWRVILGIGPLDDRPPVLVMMAALEPRKRHCEFLEAFPEVLKAYPDARLVLPGEGPHRAQVEKKIEELGVGHNVRLLGYRTDPEKLIALADICLLTSTREGLPRVVMQYLASGKPCIVSDLAGLDEVVSHGVNGIVTPADDMQAVSRAIIELLANPTKLDTFTKGAAATDLSSWRVENMCAGIENVYRSLAATKVLT